MRYWLRLTLYLILAGSITFFLALLLGPLGRIVNVAFSFIAAYVVMIIGRRMFNR
jgi:hypothetical protein